MKIRLLIAVLVFGILAGVLYWSNHRKPASPSSSPGAPAMLHINQAAVTKLTIQQKGEAPSTLTKNGGDWNITQPRQLHADLETVSGALSTLASLDAERVVEQKATNLAQYGLAQPADRVTVTTKDNETHTILIGDEAPTGGTVYAMAEGDPRVFTIPSFDKESLDKSLTDLRDKRLLTVNFDKLQSVDLATKSQTIGFTHSGDTSSGTWSIAKPKPMRTDQFQVSDFVSALQGAKMDISSSGSGDLASAFARATPVATVTVTDNEASQTLRIRKEKDVYYASSTAVPGIYKVDAALGGAVDKNLDDFRNKQLFDFGYNDPNSIEIKGEKADYVFTRSDRNWFSNGKEMDPMAIEGLVSTLRDLSADKFVDSGFSSPVVQVTVTYENGGQTEPKAEAKTEKVLFAKAGKTYIAKRVDSPDLFELAATAVDNLQSAAAGIKPYKEPNKSAKVSK